MYVITCSNEAFLNWIELNLNDLKCKFIHSGALPNNIFLVAHQLLLKKYVLNINDILDVSY